MDLAANVICERTQDVDRCTSCQRIIDQLKLLVRSIIDEAVVEERSILGIGIGIYGIVDAATGTVVSSPMFNWHDIDLLQPIEEAFHFRSSLITERARWPWARKWSATRRRLKISSM